MKEEVEDRIEEVEEPFVDTRYCSTCEAVRELTTSGKCTECKKDPNANPKVKKTSRK